MYSRRKIGLHLLKSDDESVDLSQYFKLMKIKGTQKLLKGY